MLQEILNTWAMYIDKISGGNPAISGAISLWAMGVLTYLARDVPSTLWRFLVKNLTTSMTMNNGGYLESGVMYNFMLWLHPKMSSRFSRTLAVRMSTYNDTETPVLGIGYGSHLFFHGGRVFLARLSKIDSSGSERQKDEVEITTLGRSHKPLHKLLANFMPKKEENKIKMYRYSDEWIPHADLPLRPMNTVATPEEIKDKVVAQIKHFKESRDWFYSRGLPYKLAYILYGPPGTGKTSFIKTIASKFKMNVCTINIHNVSDKSLEEAFCDLPDNSVLLIEDFDSSSATKKRSSSTHGVPTALSNGGAPDGTYSPLTLTGLLNALDGISPLDNCIIFLTTNCLESIDPALYRKGRVDHLIEMKEAQPEDIRTYAQVMYPDYDMSTVDFQPLLGCRLNEALLYGKEDPEKFLESLLRDSDNHLKRRGV